MTMKNAYYEHENDTIESLVADGIDPDDIQIARLFTEILWNFHWGRDRGEPNGEIDLAVVDGVLNLRLQVWVHDNDSDDPTIKPLEVLMAVHSGSPEQQVRSIIHTFLCHEADEQMWFGNERPYHPHAEVAA